jgi:hypothetical protein
MVQITIEVPEALAERLATMHDPFPEVLVRGLDPSSPLPTEIYRSVLQFLSNHPSPQEVLDFKLTPTMQERVSALLTKNRAGQLTPAESAELDEYERINRFVRKFKIRAMQELQATS